MKFKLHALFVSLLILTLSISFVAAEDVNGDGSFADLQNIIDHDTTGSISLDRNYSFSLFDTAYKDGVNVNKTITINGNGFYLNGNDEARILKINADNVVLSNIKFINGNNPVGGAIYVNGTNCSINNCYFTGNNATNGGSIFIADRGCSVSESLFEYNHATYGTIRCEGDNLTVYNSNFMSNYVDQCGAGIWIKASNIKVLNSNFINGVAFYTGGGITFSYGNNLLIDNCSFINNSFPQYGGALLLRGNNVLANHCVFYNNEASLGGAIQSSGINNTVVNSIFDGNSALNGQSIAYKLATNFKSNENYWAMDYDTDEDFIASDLLSYYYKDANGTHVDVSTSPDNWILMKINPLSPVVCSESAFFEVVFNTLTDGFNIINYNANLPDYKTLISYNGEIFDLTIPQGKNAIFSLTFAGAGEYMILAYSPISLMIEAKLPINVTNSGNNSSNILNGSSISTLPNTGNPFFTLLLSFLCLPLFRRRL